MRGKLTAIPIALIAALLPVSASASGMTITLGSPIEVTARVLVSVPFSVVCTDIPGLTPFQEFVTVGVEQASGRSISSGTAFLFGGIGGRPLLLTCDGVTTNTLTANVLAAPNSSPFHGGPAIVSVSASRTYTNFQTLSASTGPTAVKFQG